ncbi:MAG: hypothetical protein U0X58_07815 [Flavobacteriaceae bacterium]
MRNLKKISLLILIIFVTSCNEESLIEGRIPIEEDNVVQPTDNVSFVVDGVGYSGNQLTLETQSNSLCPSFLVASSYNTTQNRGIQIINYRPTSTNIFDYFSVTNLCTQMRISVQIDGISYLSKTGTFTVTGNTFTLVCTAVLQDANGLIGSDIHDIFATGTII